MIPPALFAQVTPATPPAGGMLERIFLVLKADPLVGVAALAITGLAIVSTALWKAQRDRTAAAEAEATRLRTSLEAEQQKRIDLAMTVVALQTKTGVVLDEAMATLTSIDDVLPTVLTQLERLGVRRKPGTTGPIPVVKPGGG